MLQFTKKRKGKPSIWMYILVYFLIAGSDCTLFCFNQNKTFVNIARYSMVATSGVFLLLVLLKSKGKIKVKYLFLVATIVLVLFTALYYGEFSGGYISLISLFILGSTFFDIVDSKIFKKVFLDLMTVVCVVSLLTFLFPSFFLSIPIFPPIYNILGREYHFFIFSNISVIDQTRNYGLFTEPSRFQAYINLCLIFLLFNKGKIDLRRIILFVITLITTLSTTGFVAFLIIMMAFILSPDVGLKANHKSLLLIFLGIGVVTLLFLSEDFVWAILKISAGETSRSASTRFNSFFANCIIILKYFPFGTGITHAEQAFSDALSSLGNVHASANTITLLIYFSKFGFAAGLFYFVNLIEAIPNICNGINSLLILLAFLAMTCGISMVESILFSIIIFYPKNEENRICNVRS